MILCFRYTHFIWLLVEKGSPDVNAKTDELNTPLHFAASYGHLEVVK